MGLLDVAGWPLPAVSPLVPVAFLLLPKPDSLLAFLAWYWVLADVVLLAWLACAGSSNVATRLVLVHHLVVGRAHPNAGTT